MFNENIDLKKAQEAYAKNGWVTINNVLQPDIAEDIRQTLISDIPWDLFYTKAKGGNEALSSTPEFITYTPDQLSGLSPEQERIIASEIHVQARKGFAFLYYRNKLYETNNLYKIKSPMLREFYDTLGSEKYCGIIRYISSELNINRRYAVATCYKPSSFLKQHNDYREEENRKVAHIFGFTKEWQPHWGGMLHLLDDEENIEHVLKPGFNSLTLFKVPKKHFVSQVSTFAPVHRFSITGWFLG